MAGHSKWQQIRHKKGVTDARRGSLFSKLVSAVQAAAQDDPDPETNIRLRNAITKAREANVPQETVLRAVSRAKESPKDELFVEVYGVEGTAFLITGLTDSVNRSMQELKQLFGRFGAKLAPPRSVSWLFTRSPDDDLWTPSFTVSTSPESRRSISGFLEALDARDDITRVFTNADLASP